MANWFRRQEAADPPLLDRDFLVRLGRHIGMDELRELLADGLIELTDRLDALDRHARAGEIEEVASLCHDIAGAAGHLGLTRLSLAAVDGVRRCRGGPDVPALEIVAPMLEAKSASIEAAHMFCKTVGSEAAAGTGDGLPP